MSVEIISIQVSDAKCAHCLGRQRGSATVNTSPLCHPDRGLDCYRLVTVHGHHMPCLACADARLVGA